jgi:hypothetical protein
MRVLGSVRKWSRNISNTKKERKSSEQKNFAEDMSDESEVEGHDSRRIYYKKKYSGAN